MGKTNNFRSAGTLQQAREIQAREGRVVLPRNVLQAQAKRREQVKEYLMRGVPKTVMAELLGTTPKTIYEDVRAIKSAVGRNISGVKGNLEKTFQEVGMIAGRLRSVTDAAMAEYALARTPSAKDRFLNTATKAEWIRARLLMEAGILPRAGEEIRVTNSTEVTFSARFGHDSPLVALDDPSSRRKIMSALEAVLEQVPETVPATVVQTAKPT